MIRKVLLSVLGHVDHGKTSLLDRIRQSTVTEGEAGLITQSIGASIIPIETVQRVCKDLLKNKTITIPGLLAIDTPGHAAFTSLRKRGGALADIAILVVDINEGFKPQTLEALEILRAAKTPFIIAANKIDLLKGWQSKPDEMLLTSINNQSPQTVQEIETKLYEIVAKVNEHSSMNADRFDRVQDYTQQAAVVPISAKTGEGLPELLMVLIGLAQKYLEQNLEIEVTGPGKGTVLETKEDKGLGSTVDVILYDGSLKVNDTIVIAGLNGPIVTKVKALFEPNPHADMRDKKTKYLSVKEVHAATGVKVAAKELQEALVGMPLIAVHNDEGIEQAKEKVQQEVTDILIEKEGKGIIIKADSLGSLEALQRLLKEKNIPIRKANIGNITKKDLVDAESNYEEDPLTSVILGFNISCDLPPPEKVKVITHDVIYTLLESFEEWQDAERKRQEAKELETITRPAKVQVMKGYVFRQSSPAIVGVDILAGTLKNNVQLMNQKGDILTGLKGMQHEKKAVQKAEKGKQVAASLPNVTVGRQIHEEDILYTALSENDFRVLKEYKQFLTAEEKTIMKEIAQIMREKNPVWGV